MELGVTQAEALLQASVQPGVRDFEAVAAAATTGEKGRARVPTVETDLQRMSVESIKLTAGVRVRGSSQPQPTPTPGLRSIPCRSASRQMA